MGADGKTEIAGLNLLLILGKNHLGAGIRHPFGTDKNVHRDRVISFVAYPRCSVSGDHQAPGAADELAFHPFVLWIEQWTATGDLDGDGEALVEVKNGELLPFDGVFRRQVGHQQVLAQGGAGSSAGYI